MNFVWRMWLSASQPAPEDAIDAQKPLSQAKKLLVIEHFIASLT